MLSVGMRKYCFLFGMLIYFLHFTCALSASEKNTSPVFSEIITAQSLINIHLPFVSGSPFFIDEFKYAVIKLKSGRVLNKVRMKIDLVSNQTHIMTSNGMEGQLDAGMVKEISFTDTTSNGLVFYKFISGLPEVDKNSPNHFYQVLEEGKCSFLKYYWKKVTERKNVFNGETLRDYETYDQYYIYFKNTMKPASKDMDFYLSEFADRLDQVKAFITENNTNFRKEDQVQKLIAYYNAL